MTLNSMTGFTRASASFEGYHWTWEIKSVNGKGLDIRLRLPGGFDELDRPVRETLGRYLTRGSCFVTLSMQMEGKEQVLKINESVLEAVLSAMKLVEGKANLAPASMDGLLAIRGVLEPVEEQDSEELRKELITQILVTFEEAAKDLVAMRVHEGAALQQIVEQRVDELESLTKKAEDCPARQPEAIAEKLRSQIARILEAERSFDEDRLYQEAVLLAGKADIREELDRLYAHCQAVRDLLATAKPVGRKLDFLAQEFNREANTLCSKSNDTSLTAIGLDLKAVIEQLREQIQNVE
ncbi:MAG: YicC family protein [Cohaesibacter sp.]|nr:YicC family protein [Cohaesibacter sp.]